MPRFVSYNSNKRRTDPLGTQTASLSPHPANATRCLQQEVTLCPSSLSRLGTINTSRGYANEEEAGNRQSETISKPRL
jgi:hypothetical protein